MYSKVRPGLYVTSMRALALASIGVYQRYISPHKGFCCAYRAHTGGASCSQLAYRAIRRLGVFTGLGVLRWRLAECAAAFKARHGSQESKRRQRGSCDAPCDIPDVSCAVDVCNSVPCDCGGCDFGPNDTRPKHKQTQGR